MAFCKGRKLGVLVYDGADAALIAGLKEAPTKQGAMVKFIAPMIGGVVLSDGSLLEAQHAITGGPSILFDAVALLLSKKGIAPLLKMPPARDFVADAFAHCKFIGFTNDALRLLQKTGIAATDMDDACINIAKLTDSKTFLYACVALRFWDREKALAA